MSDEPRPHKLTRRQLIFVDEYLKCFNGSEAARKAGYAEKYVSKYAFALMQNPQIKQFIAERIAESQMSADEALILVRKMANGEIPTKRVISHSSTDVTTTIETYEQIDALDKVLRVSGKYKETNGDAGLDQAATALSALPADLIAPAFLDVYRDIKAKRHTEYVLKGGRGSTKSSFVSLAIFYLLINNPDTHVLALRQVKDTLRDSVYGQLKWAINELGLTDSFKCTLSPLEIEYIPTKQKIYFRGADDPANIKSIKPPFGHIGILWFEELDQFHGLEQVRNIVQSALRGGEEAFMFKSFNPPRTSSSWVNKYCQIPKANQYQHHSSYLTVPAEWLGKPWIEEAEHLKEVNPKAYEHEYLGIANGTGGRVFENVVIRKITDDEIGQFDHVLHGLDWGYYPDPVSYGRMHYDAARMTLYIYAEYRSNKQSNRVVYDALIQKGWRTDDLLIADSAEPKSIADFREYGANIRGAEKGPDSVSYSMKWLQSLNAIIIDNERAPEHADEFLDYELDQDKNGEIISAYPDKNNHAIDDVRYATNLIWRRRGQ